MYEVYRLDPEQLKDIAEIDSDIIADVEKLKDYIKAAYRDLFQAKSALKDIKFELSRGDVHESIVFESYQNIASERNKRAIRKAVDIINRYIDDEAVYLPDVLYRESETYWQLKDYVGSDWHLDADEIINDLEKYSSDGWDPRPYLFNVLTYVVGYRYEDSEKLLNL